MCLAHSLSTAAEVSPDQWVMQSLEATVRSRRLPAEQVVWLVIGWRCSGIGRSTRSIHDVVDKLDLALPGISLTVAPSSVAEARARLGP